MRSPETERLLQDVVQDEEYAAFRERMLRESRAAFRAARHRRVRPAVTWLALAATLLFVATLAWRFAANRPTAVASGSPVQPSQPAQRTLTPAIPAPAVENQLYVRSTPAPSDWIVRSAPAPTLALALTTGAIPDSILVRTSPDTYQPIDDRELLALVAPDGGGLLTDPANPTAPKRLYIAHAP